MSLTAKAPSRLATPRAARCELAERWRIRSGAAEGGAFVQESTATMVLRSIEGQWKLSILAPWGWGSVVGPHSAIGADQIKARRPG
jgi:hypothetical protein